MPSDKTPQFSFVSALILFFLLFAGPGLVAQPLKTPAEKDTAAIPEGWRKLPGSMPEHWINDYETSLTPPQEKYLDSLITVLFKRTTIELFLVTIDSTIAGKAQYDDLGLYLLQNWFARADSNSWGGIIIVSKSLKKIRIFSNRKLEQLITEAEMKSVVEQGFLPGYKAGDFYRGTREGTTKLSLTLRKNYDEWAKKNEMDEQQK